MTDITLISGSTLGSTEYVAEYVAEKLEDVGFTTKIFHGPKLHDLPQQGIWLIITSTYGAGELPDNLQPLFDEINEKKTDLTAVCYGAIGIGNSEYDLFCGAIKIIDTLLTNCGSKRIGDIFEIDVLEHDIPEDPAGEWVENWITMFHS